MVAILFQPQCVIGVDWIISYYSGHNIAHSLIAMAVEQTDIDKDFF